MMHCRLVGVAALSFIGAAACDRPAPPPGVVAAQGPQATVATVVTVRAGGTATLSMRNGELLVLQHGDGRAVARIYRADGTFLDLAAAVGPRAAAALGDAAARPQVQAVAPAADGGILILLGGTQGARSLCSLWDYVPGRDGLRLLAGPDDLARQSGLGTLLDLSDGQLTGVGDDAFLALHGPGGAAFFRLDGRQLAGGVARLARPFTQLTDDDGPLALQGDDVWYGRPDGSLNLFRSSTGGSWRVDRSGHATADPPPPGRPAASTPPLDLPTPPGTPPSAAGRRLWFFPDTLTADAALSTAAPAVARYPAFVVRGGGGDVVFDRDAWVTRPGFPAHALRLVAWCPDPSTGDVLAFDAMSGDVVRITLAE